MRDPIPSTLPVISVVYSYLLTSQSGVGYWNSLELFVDMIIGIGYPVLTQSQPPDHPDGKQDLTVPTTWGGLLDSKALQPGASLHPVPVSPQPGLPPSSSLLSHSIISTYLTIPHWHYSNPDNSQARLGIHIWSIFNYSPKSDKVPLASVLPLVIFHLYDWQRLVRQFLLQSSQRRSWQCVGRWKFGHLNTQSDAGESYKKQEVGSELYCTGIFQILGL